MNRWPRSIRRLPRRACTLRRSKLDLREYRNVQGFMSWQLTLSGQGGTGSGCFGGGNGGGPWS